MSTRRRACPSSGIERDDAHLHACARESIAKLRAASNPVLLARLDEAVEIVRLVRAGRACHIDLELEIRSALRRDDRAYAIELARDTGRLDQFINGIEFAANVAPAASSARHQQEPGQ